MHTWKRNQAFQHGWHWCGDLGICEDAVWPDSSRSKQLSRWSFGKVRELYKYLQFASEEEAGEYNQKQRAIAEALGRKPPKEVKKPEYSYTASTLIEAYNVISRSRRYEQGAPLALGIADLNAYCEQYELPVERYIFNAVIFDLDNRFIDEAYKRMQKKSA